MDYFKAAVKKYEKKYNKRSKTGNVKQAKTIQYSIPLQKDNPFQEEDFIYILKKNQLETLTDMVDKYKKADISAASDSKKFQEEMEAFQKEIKYLEDVISKCRDEMADITSERDILQNQLDHQKSKVRKLTTSNQDLQNSVNKKQSKIDRINEENKKALKDLNHAQNELNKYVEAKGKLEVLLTTFQGKGRFSRWISGLDADIKILEDSLKMLPGDVEQE
jgi:chromosome segregation ATPase